MSKNKTILSDSDSDSACIYISLQERIDKKYKDLENMQKGEDREMLVNDIICLENVLDKYREVEKYLIANNLISS